MFTIYDYKADKCIHVGGNKSLDIKNLINDLNKLLKNTEPLEYTAKYYYGIYNREKYSYKN